MLVGISIRVETAGVAHTQTLEKDFGAQETVRNLSPFLPDMGLVTRLPRRTEAPAPFPRLLTRSPYAYSRLPPSVVTCKG